MLAEKNSTVWWEMMTENRDLHIRRLTEAQAEIPVWKRGSENALSAKFEAWKKRTLHSLQVLFGEDHHYARSFDNLSWWLTRISLGQQGVQWSAEDQALFNDDLTQAAHILGEALEELPSLAPPKPAVANNVTSGAPTIVVSVHNVLSQVTTVTQEQVFAEIEAIPLDAVARATALRTAGELAAELRGEQRWPVMAKALETLKGLGKGVYEKVALPLLLELVKRQSGLS